LRGGYCLKTADPHRFIQAIDKKISAAIHPRKKSVVPVQVFRSETEGVSVPFLDETVIPIDLVYPIESPSSDRCSGTEPIRFPYFIG
jgi:hypothetical protein